MVDKILNKDKNYNLCVAKVTEKQNKIDILKKDIVSLEIELQKLKNDCKIFLKLVTDEDLNSTKNTHTSANSFNMEESDTQLIATEKKLQEELKLLQEKHKNVKLVYEKVVDNIKVLCKIDSKKDESTINLSQSIPNIEESKADMSNFNNNVNSSQFGNIQEEEILKYYVEFIENTKTTIDSLFLKHSREVFMKLMKEKGIEPTNVITKPKVIEKEKTVNKRVPSTSSNATEKNLQRDLTQKSIFMGNEEYEYNDEELLREDDEIKQEKDEIMKQYKAIVNFYFII
jgi:hypothetical protein